jgi:predicted transcriptional regulator
MSGDQVAAYLGLSQYQVKKYLRENGIARSRKESTSKAAHTLRQKAANSALSAYDMQELRDITRSIVNSSTRYSQWHC